MELKYFYANVVAHQDMEKRRDAKIDVIRFEPLRHRKQIKFHAVKQVYNFHINDDESRRSPKFSCSIVLYFKQCSTNHHYFLQPSPTVELLTWCSWMIIYKSNHRHCNGLVLVVDGVRFSLVFLSEFSLSACLPWSHDLRPNLPPAPSGFLVNDHLPQFITQIPICSPHISFINFFIIILMVIIKTYDYMCFYTQWLADKDQALVLEF